MGEASEGFSAVYGCWYGAQILNAFPDYNMVGIHLQSHNQSRLDDYVCVLLYDTTSEPHRVDIRTTVHGWHVHGWRLRGEVKTWRLSGMHWKLYTCATDLSSLAFHMRNGERPESGNMGA